MVIGFSISLGELISFATIPAIKAPPSILIDIQASVVAISKIMLYFSLLLALCCALVPPYLCPALLPLTNNTILRTLCGLSKWDAQSPIVFPVKAPHQDPWNILYHLGGNSPWIQNVDGDDINTPVGCRVDQAHMVGIFISGSRQVGRF